MDITAGKTANFGSLLELYQAWSSPFRRFSPSGWKNGMRWFAMSIFLFIKFYNFIKDIMRIHSNFKKPKTYAFILNLITF